MERTAACLIRGLRRRCIDINWHWTGAHVKEIGLTEYLWAGVKSHKSTCQELYKKDQELHMVWDSLFWKEEDRVM